ncbi:MAG: hypothetical protein ABEI86_14285 [Halobacteriaceae archaeon]
MVNEAYVNLLCPNCSRSWESNPSSLPKHDEEFTCPECNAKYKVAEFMRTDRDLETLKQLQEE